MNSMSERENSWAGPQDAQLVGIVEYVGVSGDGMSCCGKHGPRRYYCAITEAERFQHEARDAACTKEMI